VKKCTDHDCPRSTLRRTLLKGGAAGSLLLTLPFACNNGAVSPPTGPVVAGNVSAVAVGTLIAVPGEAVILGRDANGLYAMSAACTHAGCMVGPTTASGVEELYCPCHGSVFDTNGEVTRGPARTPLPHFQVDVGADGTITVQGGMPVSADARTAVA
jgi:cytochrome b6-f complex iron-sulfur subunit